MDRELVKECKKILSGDFDFEKEMFVLESMKKLFKEDDFLISGAAEILAHIGEMFQEDHIGFPKSNQLNDLVLRFDKWAKSNYVNIFDEDIDYSFKKFYHKHYKYRLRAEILRGKGELTGNIIHIQNSFANGILVEFGVALGSDGKVLSELEEDVIKSRYKAVIVTHGHVDHAGLVHLIDKSIPVYMGEKTLALYKLNNPSVDTSHFIAYNDGEPFFIGDANPIKVTPFLCDHSAPDSFMLLFESNGESILYTGDFRSSGRKNFDKLLSKLPKKIGLLLCENTNGSETNKKCYSENVISDKIKKILTDTEKPTFLFCATKNIDRIVSAYKAAAKSGRDLLIDIEEEKILRTLGGGVPRAESFDRVKVYFPNRKERGDFLDVRNKTVSINELSKRSDYLMIVKASSLGYLKKLVSLGADLKGSVFIYSIWSGYRETENTERFLTEIERLGMKIVTIHTSGHATKKDIERLIKETNPNEIIYVHERKNAIDKL